MKIEIAIPDQNEEEEIDDMLMVYNLKQVPPAQEEPFVKICRCARDENGNLLGGVLAYSVLWNVLHIVTVSVKKEARGLGIGKRLLREVEEEAGRQGCYMAHLDTFDFQAAEFYEKNGYKRFGTLPDYPKGHEQYYYCKRLDGAAMGESGDMDKI